jgi:Fur family transcriptional regulator, iron response regulator
MEPTTAMPDLIDQLRSRGITPTKQRITIADVLFQKKQHVSADQLLDIVRREDATVSRATVYNTLNLFLNKKLIKALIIDKSKVVYDTNTSIHHHILGSQNCHTSLDLRLKVRMSLFVSVGRIQPSSIT